MSLATLVKGRLHASRGNSINQGMDIRNDICQWGATSNSVLLEHKGVGWEWGMGWRGQIMESYPYPLPSPVLAE